MNDIAHDPGGKVRLRLGEGVRGDAVMSADGRYRSQIGMVNLNVAYTF